MRSEGTGYRGTGAISRTAFLRGAPLYTLRATELELASLKQIVAKYLCGVLSSKSSEPTLQRIAPAVEVPPGASSAASE